MEQFHHFIYRLRKIRTWQLVILFILASFITATFWRYNNVGMVERREAVLAADREGRDGDISNRLWALQQYVSQHMNTDTGQILLQEQYRRAGEAAYQAASEASGAEGNVSEQADAICRPRFTAWSPAYVQCFIDELDKFPPAPNPDENVKIPDVRLFVHSFIGPRWSPDFAGFSLLVSIVMALIIIGRWLQLLLLYLLLKLRRKGIFS